MSKLGIDPTSVGRYSALGDMCRCWVKLQRFSKPLLVSAQAFAHFVNADALIRQQRKINEMNTKVVASVFAAALVCFSIAAFAGGKKAWKADPDRGLRLANTLCAGCHVVSPGQQKSAVAGVPTFRAIANLDGRTDQHISNTLIRPHSPMPNVQLTQHEIADLLAYFGTLRKSDADKQNKHEKIQSRPKPVYPSPS